ncbi:MAG: hypothetical protein ACK5HL_02425 [Bacilli bacterium]
MKNILSVTGVMVLLLISFFYTEKTVLVLQETDPIKIEINSKKDEYYKKAIDAIIKKDTIIPGIYGKEIDVNASYLNMKNIGVFSKANLKFKHIKPNISVKDNKNKYIISANPQKNSVSIVFLVKNDNYIDEILNILKFKNVKADFFVNSNLEDTIYTNILNDGHSIGNYGNNGIYTSENTKMINNKLNKITSNKTDYCLLKEKKSNIFNVCNKVILYNSIIQNGYSDAKTKLNSGEIIIFNLNYANIKDMGSIISLIQKKGLNITTLNNHLSEEELK